MPPPLIPSRSSATPSWPPGSTTEQPIAVAAEPLDDGRTRVTIVGYDYLGELSVICGLMFAYGFSILDGYVYTYEPAGGARRPAEDRRRVHRAVAVGWRDAQPTNVAGLRGRPARPRPPPAGPAAAGRAGRAGEARRGSAAAAASPARLALPPVEIEIDNDASERYTVLQISAPDTPGFLYEFTNALALSGVHISQVFVISAGARVRDTLFVTDAAGRRSQTEARQRELRAATVLIKHFTHLLPRSPNPESALHPFPRVPGRVVQPALVARRARLAGTARGARRAGPAAGRLRVPVGRLPAHAVREPLPGRAGRGRAGAARSRPSSCAANCGRVRLSAASWRDAAERVQGPRDVPHRHAPHPRPDRQLRRASRPS